MPYIKQEKRPELDTLSRTLIEHLAKMPQEEQDGAVNYVVTKMLHAVYPKKYFHFNRALGVLSAITHEYYRRRVAPYEDEKVLENGDIS